MFITTELAFSEQAYDDEKAAFSIGDGVRLNTGALLQAFDNTAAQTGVDAAAFDQQQAVDQSLLQAQVYKLENNHQTRYQSPVSVPVSVPVSAPPLHFTPVSAVCVITIET